MGMVTTTTLTRDRPLPIPSTSSSIHLPSEPVPSAQLREQYKTAANAFLRRDFAMVHTCITNALSLLPPPVSVDPSHDIFAQQRRQWAILQNTLSTTVHGLSTQDIPAVLKEERSLSVPALLNALHMRSARLFTPASFQPSSAWIPAPIMHTLVLAALKFDVPETGRGMIEDWLARRTPGPLEEGHDGYNKLIDLYCLHVLPRVNDWDYAKEFLQYETELPSEKRELLKEELAAAYLKSIASATDASIPEHLDAVTETISTGSSSLSRSSSPTPSTASSQTARPNRTPLTPLTPLASTSGTSSSSQKVTRGRTAPPGPGRLRTRPREPAISERGSEDSLPSHSFPVPPRADPISPITLRVPGHAALVGATLFHKMTAMIRWAKRSPSILLAAIFTLISLISFVMRIRRPLRNVALTPRQTQSNILRQALRSVADTVMMAGRGLV